MATKAKKTRPEASPAKRRAEAEEEQRRQQEADLEGRLEGIEDKAPENPPERTAARTAAGAEAERMRQQDDAAAAKRLREADQTTNAVAKGRQGPSSVPEGHQGGKFLLLAGSYDDLRTGTHYDYNREHDTVVETDIDLDKLFANKFRRLDGPQMQWRDQRDDVVDRGHFDPPLALRHPQGVQTTFTGDAERIAADREARAPQKASSTKAPKEESEADEAEESELGEDVTGRFEGAEDAGLCVFKDGKSYFVADKDAPGDALNRKPLRRDAVADFVEKHAADKE